MKILRNTSPYNERRYGKPWIARVDFSADVNGKFNWGGWLGQPGENGELSLDAQPGDIVATGQKDFRQPRNSAPKWYIVGADGRLLSCTTKIGAVRAARDFATAKPTAQIIPLAG